MASTDYHSLAKRSEGKCVAARFIAPWGGGRHIRLFCQSSLSRLPGDSPVKAHLQLGCPDYFIQFLLLSGIISKTARRPLNSQVMTCTTGYKSCRKYSLEKFPLHSIWE